MYPYVIFVFFFGGFCLIKLLLLPSLSDCLIFLVPQRFLFFFFIAVHLRNGKQENEINGNNVLLITENRIIEKP
jgi:hypothetical protein